MADFCNQCAIDLGFPIGDLAHSEREPPEPGMGYPDLCEGCGPCFVDHIGNCVDPDCDKFHGSKEGRVNTDTAEVMIAKEILRRFVLASPTLKGVGFLLCIKEIADDVCGKYFEYDIQQLHDSYTVIVKVKS